MLGKDGGVFGTWLQSQMVGVVRQEDMEAFNASLRALVADWCGRGGGLSRSVGTVWYVLWVLVPCVRVLVPCVPLPCRRWRA